MQLSIEVKFGHPRIASELFSLEMETAFVADSSPAGRSHVSFLYAMKLEVLPSASLIVNV